MVRLLNSRLGSPGLKPDWGYGVVLLSKALYSLSASLSTQQYEWVPANSQGNLMKCWGITCVGLEAVLIATWHGFLVNQHGLQLCGPVGLAYLWEEVKNFSECSTWHLASPG